jgi:hypothetical protein
LTRISPQSNLKLPEGIETRGDTDQANSHSGQNPRPEVRILFARANEDYNARDRSREQENSADVRQDRSDERPTDKLKAEEKHVLALDRRRRVM